MAHGLSSMVRHMSIKRFRATIIVDIWLEVLFFSLVATAVCLVSHFRVDLGVSNQILTVLGTVLGLVVSFRTSSAYERYQEGRKLWTSITLASRNLATIIWVQVPVDRPVKPGASEESVRNQRLEAVIEKRSMIHLVQAFSVSVKHLLRGEPGVFYQDLFPLISFLPRYAPQKGVSEADNLPVWDAYGLELKPVDSRPSSAGTKAEDTSRANSPSSTHSKTPRRRKTFDPEKALPEVDCPIELRPARIPPHETIYDRLPFLLIFKPIVSLFTILILRRRHSADETLTFSGKHRKKGIAESNVPLEINLFLSTYFLHLQKQSLITPAVASAFLTGLMSLQDSVANLERVRNTPLPFAYQAHLRMCMWLYLALLPFQIYSAYKWLTIPATAFAAFLLLGFLEIGQQIEDPFGYDQNDIDVDEICLGIQRELHEITAHPAPEPASYIYTAFNQPFAPSDRRTAVDILHNVNHEYHVPDTGMGSLHKTMLRNWREVNTITRKQH